MQMIDQYIKPHLHPRLTASPYAYRDFKAALYGFIATTAAMLLELFNFILIDFQTGSLIALSNFGFSVLLMIILIKSGRLRLMVLVAVGIVSCLLAFYTIINGGLHLKSTFWISLSISLLVLTRSTQLAVTAVIGIICFFFYLNTGELSSFEKSIREVDSTTVSALGPLISNIAFTLAFFGILYAFHLSSRLSLQLYTAELEKKKKHNHKLTELLDQLQHTQQELVATKNLAALGKLTAGMAHEMNNPINSIKGSAQALDLDFQDLKPIFNALSSLQPTPKYPQSLNELIEKVQTNTWPFARLDESVQQIQSNAVQIRATLDTLQHFTYQSEDEFTPIPLKDLLDSTLIILGAQIRERNIDVILEDHLELPSISGQTGRTNQALAILMTHFIAKIKKGTSLHISGETSAQLVQIAIKGVAENATGFVLKDDDLSLQYAMRTIETQQGKIQYQALADTILLQLQFPIAHF